VRVFDDILDTLSDGEFHEFEEIKKAAPDKNETQVDAVLEFFEDYGLLTRHRSRGTAFGPIVTKGAQLSKSMLKFLKKIKEASK